MSILSCKKKCEKDIVFVIPTFISSNCEGINEGVEHRDCAFREMLVHIYDTLTYPQLAIDNKIEGDINVRFRIGLDGNTKELEIVNGIGFGCDEEALRVVETLNYNPAKNECGDDIVSTMTLLIRFNL